MARGSNRGERDTSDIANGLDPLLEPPSLPTPVQVSPFDLSLLQDNRTYHPEAAFRPPLSFSGYTDLEVSPNVNKRTPVLAGALPYGVAFSSPTRVGLCVRRSRRRQVLFALNKTWKSGRGGKRHRNRWSNVRC